MTLLEVKKKKFNECEEFTDTRTYIRRDGRPHAYVSFIYGENTPKFDVIIAESAITPIINRHFRSEYNSVNFPYSTRTARIEPIFEIMENLNHESSLRMINPSKWPLMFDMIAEGSFIPEISKVLYRHGLNKISQDTSFDGHIVKMINEELSKLREEDISPR